SGRSQRVARRAAHHPAVAHDAGRAGATQRQGHRHRHALRSAAPAGGHPLMRIAVLTGGATPGRAVAFASASQIVAALRSRKHDVRVVDLAGSLMDERAERELLGGAVGLTPPAVDALAERERRMLSEGLAALEAVRNAEVLFLAVHGGALEGGTLQARYDCEVMAEQLSPGIELTVGVLGDVPLPVGQIVPKHELFDYETKYTPGMSEETFPARIDTALARQLQEYALMAHRALK